MLQRLIEKEWYEDHRKSLIVCWANFQWLPNSTQEQPQRGRQKNLRKDLGESRKNKFSAHDYTSWHHANLHGSPLSGRVPRRAWMSHSWPGRHTVASGSLGGLSERNQLLDSSWVSPRCQIFPCLKKLGCLWNVYILKIWIKLKRHTSAIEAKQKPSTGWMEASSIWPSGLNPKSWALHSRLRWLHSDLPLQEPSCLHPRPAKNSFGFQDTQGSSRPLHLCSAGPGMPFLPAPAAPPWKFYSSSWKSSLICLQPKNS